MANSILENTGEQAPVTDLGHGTEALGPSDSSDSGSDIQGARGLGRAVNPGLDTGTNEDPENVPDGGSLIGDADLSSDSDSVGTGEHASVPDTFFQDGRDIAPDHIERINRP